MQEVNLKYMSRLYYFCFTLFTAFYLLTASVFSIPYISLLRWVGSALLVFYSFFYDEKSLS